MHFEKFLAKAYRVHSGFRCYDDAMEFIVQQRNYIQRKDFVQQQKNRLIDGISKLPLFPYQQTGVLSL